MEKNEISLSFLFFIYTSSLTSFDIISVPKHLNQLQDMAEQCGGYDFETKEKNLNYECPICKKIIRQFTELPCEHATCKSCIKSWEVKKLEMFRQIDER